MGWFKDYFGMTEIDSNFGRLCLKLLLLPIVILFMITFEIYEKALSKSGY